MTSLLSILLVLLVPSPSAPTGGGGTPPWVTWTLIALNTVVYVGTVLYSRHYVAGRFVPGT